MAYVRQHGNQLAIVHGERDPETKKVQQRVLFTIYSQPEAREILGQGGKKGPYRFQSLMQRQYPELRFNWKKLHQAISEKFEVLPETYEYQPERLQGSFRADLCAFTRQLALADPQRLFSAAQLIKSQHEELVFLRELIDWRLQTCEQEESEWNRNDPFYWLFALTRRKVPPEIEEFASGLYEKGLHEQAERRFRLLLECFENYAEGHNYLGLIALHRDDLNEAITQFERTIELGRRNFPKRIAKKDYWSVLETRPYMRGLRNLCLALNRARRYEEALALCERIERECGDDVTAEVYRTAIYLNLGSWEQAFELGDRLHRLYAEENLNAALAAFELERRDEATWRYLHGALNTTRAARMLLGLRTPLPSTRSFTQVRDHSTGVFLLNTLGGFLEQQSTASKRFFRKLLRDPGVVALLEEREAAIKRWEGPHDPHAEWRAAFNRMQLMATPEFAREQSGRLAGVNSKKTKTKTKTKRRSARSQ